jgi:isoquinoline 1-oxidoreductase beta subunit
MPASMSASLGRAFCFRKAAATIEPDDTVIIRYPRSEMGQGSFTALPMMVAEELEADWSKVTAEFASANRNLREDFVYGKDMSSVGSHSVRLSHQQMQQIGASARVRLVRAAAKRWGVSEAECTANLGKVTHQPTGRSLRYGALAADAAKILLDKEPQIKAPEQWTLAGTPKPRLDVPLKINGTAAYGIDTRVPGMVYAAVLGCPVPGGTLKSVEDSAAKAMRGVETVVKLESAVAVVADRFWRAKKAAEALKIEWDPGAGAGSDSTQFAKAYRAALDGPAATARNDGDVDAAMQRATQRIEAVYEVPYLAHAPMEPLNATAHYRPERLDVWIGTQNALATLTTAAQAAGLPPACIIAMTTAFEKSPPGPSRSDRRRISRALRSACPSPHSLSRFSGISAPRRPRSTGAKSIVRCRPGWSTAKRIH